MSNFKGAAKIDGNLVENALNTRAKLNMKWRKIETRLYEKAAENFKPTFWQKHWKGITSFDGYIDYRKGFWSSRFQTAVKLGLIELSEQENELYNIVNGSTGHELYEKESYQLECLLVAKSDIYITPGQGAMIEYYTQLIE